MSKLRERRQRRCRRSRGLIQNGDRGPWAVAHGYMRPPLSRLGIQLQNLITLDSDYVAFCSAKERSFLEKKATNAEIKKLRGKGNPLSAAALKALRDEDARTLAPARLLAAEAMRLEHEPSDLVNAVDGLSSVLLLGALVSFSPSDQGHRHADRCHFQGHRSHHLLRCRRRSGNLVE